MEGALDRLDRGEAPGHIGAHLDLAIEQLRTHLSNGSQLLDHRGPSSEAG